MRQTWTCELVGEELADLVAGLIRTCFARQAEILAIDEGRYPNYVAFETSERLCRRMRRGYATALARLGDTPVGTVSFSATNDEDHVARLGILPDHRGNDYGAILMTFAEQRLRESGLERAELGIVAQSTGLRRFYERLGYVAYRQHDVPTLPFTVLRMRKPLS